MVELSMLDCLGFITPWGCLIFCKKKEYIMTLLCLSLLVLSQIYAGRISYHAKILPNIDFKYVHINICYNKVRSISIWLLRDPVVTTKIGMQMIFLALVYTQIRGKHKNLDQSFNYPRTRKFLKRVLFVYSTLYILTSTYVFLKKYLGRPGFENIGDWIIEAIVNSLMDIHKILWSEILLDFIFIVTIFLYVTDKASFNNVIAFILLFTVVFLSLTYRLLCNAKKLGLTQNHLIDSYLSFRKRMIYADLVICNCVLYISCAFRTLRWFYKARCAKKKNQVMNLLNSYHKYMTAYSEYFLSSSHVRSFFTDEEQPSCCQSFKSLTPGYISFQKKTPDKSKRRRMSDDISHRYPKMKTPLSTSCNRTSKRRMSEFYTQSTTGVQLR